MLSAEHRLTNYGTETRELLSSGGAVALERVSPGAEELLIRKESERSEKMRLKRLMQNFYAMCADDEEELAA